MSQPIQFESNIALINYPKQAAFGRTLPKNKIYEHSGANTRLKDLFIEQVELIVWRYKLAQKRLTCPLGREYQSFRFSRSSSRHRS